ncbi:MULTISPECIES: phage tail spike protein [Bacillus amyloliquefaciens group]|uniref:phage tail spike protein n=1 Tax=Bacillus amyloliquefaciens group TaxID=1938374 RepID=UPI0028096BF2|nr:MULTISPECIES: phage tail spike protein [Bacillus amyloliquefaciens group]MDQ8093956.1 phage tail spike protein [Bacillus amyloliquefaciens]WPF78408.1 phage tail spike protein [Bacillus velezensis]
MADMYILSPDDELLTVLSSHGQETCMFWDAKYKEELNKGSSFSFVADASHPDARFLFQENQVVFRDKDGNLRLFVIKEMDDTDEEGETNTLVTCEAAMMELAETRVKDFRPTNKTAQFVLDNVLSRSRWVAEVKVELGVNSTTFYKKSALDCIADVINIWGGELQDTIEFDGNKVTRRIIKILPRRGKDSGKRFEIDKDTINIRRTVISYPVTALWGYGASIASTDDDGEETGGYSRFIDFAEVEWKKSKGDPVDKPLGQEWVGDPDLLKQLGRLKNDVLIHREGEYNNENITDPEELLKATYDYLITTASKIEVNYELSVQLLQNIPGYEHEHVELGDTTIAIDRNFAIPIETSQRVISMEYDITDPDNTCVVEIGQFLSAYEPDTRLDKIEDSLNNIGKNIIITDENFPDIKPPVPTNVQAKGLFSKVSLSWDFEPYSYIAAYEVYASQMNGFVPSSATLIWRGKDGGCVHDAEVDQVWYYRIRALNTKGTPSDLTNQYSAATVRIGTNHIEDLSITNAKIGTAAIDTLNVANGAITNAKINSLVADKIKGGILSGVIVRSENDSGDTIELKDGTITSELNGRKTIQMYNYNLLFYDPGTDDLKPNYDIIGSLTPVWKSGNTSKRGIGLMGSKDYLTLAKQISGTDSAPFLNADFVDRKTIIGGSPNADGKWDGRLELRSTYFANWSGATPNDTNVPKIVVENSNDSTTKWGNVAIFTGRGPDKAGSENERFGFEVWQYQGDATAKQMFKIDRDDTLPGDGNYMGYYGDSVYLPYNVRLQAGNELKLSSQALGLTLSSAVTDVRGGLQSNAILRVHYWDNFNINKGSGSTAYGDGTLSIGTDVENIFFATVQAYGSYSDCVTCGVPSMTLNGDKSATISFRVRGTGTVNVEGQSVGRLMILYIYEPR